MKTIALFFASATFLLLLDSCENCPKDWQLESTFDIHFYLYDDISGENLLQIASKYYRDSTRIYDEEGRIVFPGPVPGDGRIVFSPILIDEKYPINENVQQTLYLYLTDIATSKTDVDTFQLEYLVYLDDCDEKEFSYLRFFYNEKLVFEEENWSRNLNVDLYK